MSILSPETPPASHPSAVCDRCGRKVVVTPSLHFAHAPDPLVIGATHVPKVNGSHRVPEPAQ